MKVFICLVVVSVATVNASPFIGSLITGITGLGTDIGKKTADLVTNSVGLGADAFTSAANAGFNTGKEALAGISGVSKNVLDKSGNIGHQAIDILGIVGDNLGPLGKPVKAVEGLAHKVLDTGINTGKKAIETGETVGSKSMTVADKIVEISAGTAKNVANSGSEIAKGSLNAIKEGTDKFWG